MPVKAISKTSIARNGIGAFVLPCHKISVQYCNWGGSSSGLRQLLKSGKMDLIASQKSGVVFDVVKRVGHPKLTFHYNNSQKQEVNVANLEATQIVEKLNDYSQRSGAPLFKFNHKVLSNNDSVRGIWSPMHAPKSHRHKI